MWHGVAAKQCLAYGVLLLMTIIINPAAYYNILWRQYRVSYYCVYCVMCGVMTGSVAIFAVCNVCMLCGSLTCQPVINPYYSNMTTPHTMPVAVMCQPIVFVTFYWPVMRQENITTSLAGGDKAW